MSNNNEEVEVNNNNNNNNNNNSDGDDNKNVDSIMNKTAEEKADAVSAFINTARLTGGRATFMAGFAYYSVGRYMFSCCKSNAYFAFNITALVMSIITAGTCQMFVYYALRLSDPELQYEFCIQAIWLSRYLTRINMLTNMFYTIGIGLLPWAYYQQSDMKWFPLVLMVIIAIAYYPVMFRIVKSQLLLQFYGEESYIDQIDDEKLVRDSPYGSKNRSESLEEFLLKQSNVVAGRAIFISGLAQQGIMRFMPTPVVYDDDDHAANAFLVFVSFAMALSYFSGNIFLLFQVFIPDTIKIKQLAFAILIQPMARFLFVCYIGGFIALFLGNIFVADGCNFGELRGVSIFFGFIGLLFVVICILKSAAKDAYDVNAKSDTKSDVTTVTNDEENEKKQKRLGNVLLALNTAGSMSTFAAGYLFYNIITYDSDVLRLPENEDIDWRVRCNLIANFVTVTTALYASVADTILSLNVNHYNSVSDKLNYLESRLWIVQSVIYGYYFSLIGWFVCFGFFGFVKYNRDSYVPFWYAVVGVIVMVIGTIYVHNVRKGIGEDNPDLKTRKDLTEDEVNVSISRPANLTSLGFSVIFLGGFSYFAINFFNFNDRPNEELYLHAMSLCFMTSMWVMVFADRYNYQINKCHTVASKLLFAEKTYPFYLVTVALSYIVVISLLIGFNSLGYVKYITNYKDVNREIQMSTMVIAIFCFPLMYWVGTTFKKATFATEELEANASTSEVDRFKNQVIAGLTTSGFIAGNVCYELLFAEANSDYLWLNKYYFFMMSLAFSFGVSAIIVSTLIVLCLGELPTSEKKAYFVMSLRRAKLAIFILSLSCILSWQASIMALSAVKYTGEKGGDWQSFVPGVLGLVALLRYYYGVKKISDGIRVNGRTVTAAALPEAKNKEASLEMANDSTHMLNPLILQEAERRTAEGSKTTTESFQIDH